MAHSLEPGETPSAKNDEIMTKKQFTGTTTQCNRNFCQFNKDQYCNSASTPKDSMTTEKVNTTSLFEKGYHFFCFISDIY